MGLLTLSFGVRWLEEGEEGFDWKLKRMFNGIDWSVLRIVLVREKLVIRACYYVLLLFRRSCHKRESVRKGVSYLTVLEKLQSLKDPLARARYDIHSLFCSRL